MVYRIDGAADNRRELCLRACFVADRVMRRRMPLHVCTPYRSDHSDTEGRRADWQGDDLPVQEPVSRCSPPRCRGTLGHVGGAFTGILYTLTWTGILCIIEA
jgi:hypothetical protein